MSRAHGVNKGVSPFLFEALTPSTRRPILMIVLLDAFHRPLKDLRISVTDRCNFRCTYCMPFDDYVWNDKAEILSFEEITRIARAFVALGVTQIRLTGGEPLLRRGIEQLISQLTAIDGLGEVSLTTNASLLSDKAGRLKEAGLKRLNVSLDTLNPEKFSLIRRRGDLNRVLDGVFAAKRAGLSPIKVNMVVQRGVNEEDIVPMVEFCQKNSFQLRFIEYMDVGNSNDWAWDKIVSKKEILEIVRRHYPVSEIGRENGSAPSVDYRFDDGRGSVGVIASVTEPFCSTCTRARITADGKLVTCLFSQNGHDLKALLRRHGSDEEIREVLAGIWLKRADRYSDERLAAIQSGYGYDPKKRNKIEMITLGG